LWPSFCPWYPFSVFKAFVVAASSLTAIDIAIAKEQPGYRLL
jgi:hypothetical protein